MAVHCPECGTVNADGANYCQKCGAFIGERDDAGGGATTREPPTATYRIDETGELVPVDVEDVVQHDGGRRRHRRGDRSAHHRRGDRRGEGLHDARRRGAHAHRVRR